MSFEFRISNREAIKRELEEARRLVGDLSVPLTAIAGDWFRTNRLYFQASGSGPWADLSNGNAPRGKVRGFGAKKTGEKGGRVGGYKEQKLKRWGFVYPILRASGKFERSITEPADSNSLLEILNASTLLLGSRAVSDRGAPYPKFLHTGTNQMPARGWANVQKITVARWVGILRTYVLDTLGPSGRPVSLPQPKKA